VLRTCRKPRLQLTLGFRQSALATTYEEPVIVLIRYGADVQVGYSGNRKLGCRSIVYDRGAELI